MEYSNSGRHDVRAQKKKTPNQAKPYLVQMLIKAVVLQRAPYLSIALPVSVEEKGMSKAELGAE